jgi:hypothetical protein
MHDRKAGRRARLYKAETSVRFSRPSLLLQDYYCIYFMPELMILIVLMFLVCDVAMSMFKLLLGGILLMAERNQLTIVINSCSNEVAPRLNCP